MIFLHGWPQIGLMWRAQIEAFAAEGWRCLAPDMRGYGASSAPADPGAYALVPGGHWLPLERKTEVAEAMRTWLKAKTLA